MSHPIYRILQFRIVRDYVIGVALDDGTEQTIDFRKVLAGEFFGPLRDLNFLNQVSLDPEVHTLVSPNGADFDPATLHDWQEHGEELAVRARKWELKPA
jgi:hypothetical protein